MENQDDLSLKEQKLHLRSLLTGTPSSAKAQEILRNTFVAPINWNLEEVEFELQHVYGFSPEERQTIVENYPIAIPSQREQLSRNPPLPTFTSEDTPNVTTYADELRIAREKLTQTKRLLAQNRLGRDQYKDEDDYNKSIAEAGNIESCFLEIAKFIDKEYENAQLYLQRPC